MEHTQTIETNTGEHSSDVLQKEVSRLKKQNRKLQRELDYRTQLLRKTDELYKTSERVLTKAHQDLQASVERHNALSTELHQVSRLAAVGELSARVIHEVLNPMTSLLGRLQRMQERALQQQKADSNGIGLISEIAVEWAEILSENGFPEYVTPSSSSDPSDFEADLEDMRAVLDVLAKEQVDLSSDLDFMHRTATHMVRIINNMRSLGRQQTQVTEVQVNDISADSMELVRDSLRKHGISLRENFAQALPDVKADRNEMIQIVTNLLNNAQQAMPRGGSVEVSTSQTADRVEIRVKDAGTGIPLPPDEIQMVFEGGFTTKSSEEGTGLGLAICRRFARKYHGDIEVEWTKENEGTCFLVWVPIYIKSEQQTNFTSSRSPLQGGTNR